MTKPSDDRHPADWERRAPGWVRRCQRCGFTEPLGKYAIRLGAVSWKKCTLARCPRCGRICCHTIARRPRD